MNDKNIEAELLKEINRKLQCMLIFVAKDYFDEDMTNKEKIKTLKELGFNNKEMAMILGTTEGSVRGTLSTLRDEGKIQEE